MNKIKDNWSDGDVLHASDLNKMARAINGIIDGQSSLIDDENAGDNSAYSSNKILSVIEEEKSALINDEQASNETAYSSEKINEKVEDVKLKTLIVDDLPEVGEENTLYLKPALFVNDGTQPKSPFENNQGGMMLRSGLVPTSPIRAYRNNNNRITLDVDNINNGKGGVMPSVGDVIKYKKPEIDTVTQTCWQTFFRPQLAGGDKITERLFSGLYNVGETFKLENGNILLQSNGDTPRAAIPYNFLIESYEDISIDENKINGITSKIRNSYGSIYRMKSLELIPNESIEGNTDFKNKYDVYVATFEDVTEQVSVADHVVSSLGSIFTKNKLDTKEYAVATSVNEGELNLSSSVAESEEDFASFTNGLQVMTIQDGHYYRVNDSYRMKLKNIEPSIALAYVSGFKVGGDILIYEEVSHPEEYIESEIVPFANVYKGIGYKEDVKISFPGYMVIDREEMPDVHRYYDNRAVCYTLPEGLKIGDIVKITGDNNGIDRETPYVCATSVGSAVYTNGQISNIIESREWAKNETYRFDGYHLCKLNDLLSTQISSYFGEYYMVPVFTEVLSLDYYEVEGLPLVVMGVKGEKALYDKWMWIDGEWEYLGNQVEEDFKNNILY